MGGVLKCNRNEALLETYQAAKTQSVFERVFLRDDLVEWIKFALKGNIFNRCLWDILLNCVLLIPCLASFYKRIKKADERKTHRLF